MPSGDNPTRHRQFAPFIGRNIPFVVFWHNRVIVGLGVVRDCYLDGRREVFLASLPASSQRFANCHLLFDRSRRT